MQGPGTIRLYSELALQECLRRIREASDAPKVRWLGPWKGTGSKPVFAELRDTRIKIWVHGGVKNDFAPRFVGKLSSVGSGTLLEGRFGLAPTARLIMLFFFGIGATMSMTSLTVLYDHFTQPGQEELSGFVFMPMGLLLAGILIVRYARGLSQPNKDFLLDFLQTTLQARQEEGAAPLA